MKVLNIYIALILFFTVSLLLPNCSVDSIVKNIEINAQDSLIDQVLSNMSLEEKIGQMTQINLNVILTGELHHNPKPYTIDSAKLEEAINKYFVGSFLDSGGEAISRDDWNKLISKIRKTSASSSLKIPAVYAIDAIHGANYTLESTLFPHPIAQAATWNPSLVEKIAEITAYEMQASGMNWNYSPVADLGRQPLWSGFAQTFGEDAFLASTMVGAAIDGYQNYKVAGKRIAACAKHFIAQSAPVSGKDRSPIYLAERQIRELYLPPFRKAVNSGVQSIMIGSGEINGIPTHTNQYLLTEVLRNELQFDGVLITDWGDVERLITHHKVAQDYSEAVKMIIDAGVDVCMVPNDYRFTESLIQLVQDGAIAESRIDESVKRILRMKSQLGLFDKTELDYNFKEFGNKKHSKIAYNAASEAITLLKNERETLPLPMEAKILVTGPGAASLAALNGPWSRTWQGNDQIIENEQHLNITEAIASKWPNTIYAEGCRIDSLINSGEAMRLAHGSDAIVVCLTEAHRTEKMGDLDELTLSSAQLDYVKSLAKTKKPIILVLLLNRPRIIRDIEGLADAILMAYLPGNEGATAIADIIAGVISPSGKLPFTYPRYSNSLLTYDRKNVENEDRNYGQNGFNPQWPFGYGLSYGAFEYSEISLSNDTISSMDSLVISVKITNTSNRICKETIMCYLTDEVASVTPSSKKLKRFSKLELQPNQPQEVTFILTEEDLEFIDRNNESNAEGGWFEILIEKQSARFFLKKENLIKKTLSERPPIENSGRFNELKQSV
jgi:beta-glucosidase